MGGGVRMYQPIGCWNRVRLLSVNVASGDLDAPLPLLRLGFDGPSRLLEPAIYRAVGTTTLGLTIYQ